MGVLSEIADKGSMAQHRGPQSIPGPGTSPEEANSGVLPRPSESETWGWVQCSKKPPGDPKASVRLETLLYYS